MRILRAGRVGLATGKDGTARPMRVVLGLAAVLTAGTLVVSCGQEKGSARPSPSPGGQGSLSSPRRIVSMAPSLTEVLFALGLGDAVIGVTRYCDYPPEARTRARVGGYLDPAYEAIVALEPDLVVLMQDHGPVRRRLEALGLQTLQVDQHSVEAVLESVGVIAEACGVAREGELLQTEMRAQLDAVAERTRRLRRPRVLVVVEREVGAGTVGAVWAAGPGTFYNDIVELAGGVNVLRSGGAAYPEISREGIVHLGPEVILDVAADLEARRLDPDALRADWEALQELTAVRGGRVYLLAEGFEVIPGPRITRTVETVARLLHPDLEGVSP